MTMSWEWVAAQRGGDEIGWWCCVEVVDSDNDNCVTMAKGGWSRGGLVRRRLGCGEWVR